MKLNGHLELNGLGASRIFNLHVEKVAALPAFNALEHGRLIVLNDGTFHFNNGIGWVSVATGGDAAQTAADLAAEISRATAAEDAIAADLVTEIARAIAAEGALTTAVSNEATRASAAEGVLTTNLAAEVTRATGAEGVLTDAVADEVARATAAETVLTDAVADEVARAIAAEGVLTTNLASEVTRATAAESAEATARAAADTALGTNLTTEATARADGDTALNTAITDEAATRLAADNAIAQDLLDETAARTDADVIHTNDISARVKLAGDTMSGDLDFNALYTVKGLRAPALAGDAATKSYVDALAGGLSWQAPVESTGAALPGTATTGDRFLNLTDGKIYTATATDTWNAGVTPTDGWSLFDKTNETGYVFDGAAWVQFTGTGQVTAGVGLGKTGNVIDIKLGAGIAELPTDEVGVDLFTNGGLFLTVDGTTADATNAAQIAIKLDGSTLFRGANGLKVDDATILRITTAENAITTEVSDRANADSLLTTNLGLESDARVAGDAASAALVTAEETRALTAEGVLSTAIAAEVTDRQTAITDEATTRGDADDILAADIAAEIARATAAEGDLSTAIATEVTDRNAAIAATYHLYDGASATVHTITHGLAKQYLNVTVIDAATDEQIIPQSVKFNATTVVVTLNVALAIKVVLMGA